MDRRIAIRDARAARIGRRQEDWAGGRVILVRLDHEQYRRLQRYLAEYEQETGQPLSQQAILEFALAEYLTQHEYPAN